jgi:hypothetical protein
VLFLFVFSSDWNDVSLITVGNEVTAWKLSIESHLISDSAEDHLQVEEEKKNKNDTTTTTATEEIAELTPVVLMVCFSSFLFSSLSAFLVVGCCVGGVLVLWLSAVGPLSLSLLDSHPLLSLFSFFLSFSLSFFLFLVVGC